MFLKVHKPQALPACSRWSDTALMSFPLRANKNKAERNGNMNKTKSFKSPATGPRPPVLQAMGTTASVAELRLRDGLVVLHHQDLLFTVLKPKGTKLKEKRMSNAERTVQRSYSALSQALQPSSMEEAAMRDGDEWPTRAAQSNRRSTLVVQALCGTVRCFAC